MSNPDFQAMSQQELQAYVLAHRNNQEAFYAYVDKLHAEAHWIEMPPFQSLEDLENHPECLDRLRSGSDPGDNAV